MDMYTLTRTSEKFLVSRLVNSVNFEKHCEFFDNTPRKRGMYFYFENMLSVLENLSTPLLRPLKSSRTDWHQHQKVGGP